MKRSRSIVLVGTEGFMVGVVKSALIKLMVRVFLARNTRVEGCASKVSVWASSNGDVTQYSDVALMIT